MILSWIYYIRAWHFLFRKRGRRKSVDYRIWMEVDFVSIKQIHKKDMNTEYLVNFLSEKLPVRKLVINSVWIGWILYRLKSVKMIVTEKCYFLHQRTPTIIV